MVFFLRHAGRMNVKLSDDLKIIIITEKIITQNTVDSKEKPSRSFEFVIVKP